MLIQHPPDIPASEISERRLVLGRRQFLAGSLLAVAGASLPGGLGEADARAEAPVAAGRPLGPFTPAPSRASVDDPLTPMQDATGYNNFYEFGTDKRDPARLAKQFRSEPWSVVIEGEVARPGRVPLEDLLRPHPLEERIYRLRCVEAWSMVIPWIGIPLAALLARFEPTSKARWVAFETLLDPEQMPGQRRDLLDWPYREGLRIDEAMHPLSLLAVGMYGESLPAQNGAPLRLVVPWKYGFKSIKSIVRIRLQEKRPDTSWNRQAPSEYGFYANVNPEVSHPRWSQARERRIGEYRKRPSLLFNGYADEVAGLYAGMDLRRDY